MVTKIATTVSTRLDSPLHASCSRGAICGIAADRAENLSLHKETWRTHSPPQQSAACLESEPISRVEPPTPPRGGFIGPRGPCATCRRVNRWPLRLSTASTLENGRATSALEGSDRGAGGLSSGRTHADRLARAAGCDRQAETESDAEY
jgi:hypothetical protein